MKTTLTSISAIAALAAASPVTSLARRYPSDCTSFYEVAPNDNCLSIAKGIPSIANAHPSQHFSNNTTPALGNFTLTQLYLWNQDIDQSCRELYYGTPICINTPGYVFTPPVQQPYGTHNTPDQTPVPLMYDTIASCQEYELVAPGTRVETLAEENGFEVSDFAKWNNGSNTAWADYWACIKA